MIPHFLDLWFSSFLSLLLIFSFSLLFVLRKENSERMIDGLVGEIAREGLINLALKLNNEGDATSVSRYDLPLKYRGPVKISSAVSIY